MEILVGLAIVVAIWFALRSRSTSRVAESALRALRELDALGESVWGELETEILNSEDPRTVCRAILDRRRTELPKNIDSLWSQLDDLSKRINHRAEHYEVISKRPAPRLAGRTKGDQVVSRIRELAER